MRKEDADAEHSAMSSPSDRSSRCDVHAALLFDIGIKPFFAGLVLISRLFRASDSDSLTLRRLVTITLQLQHHRQRRRHRLHRLGAWLLLQLLLWGCLQDGPLKSTP
jgi:hypothetical protein